MPDTLAVAVADHVATVTLLRPTMAPAFFAECEAAFRALAADREARVVVVRSSAKAFSYGLDLPAAFQQYGQLFAGGGAENRAELLALIRRLQGSFNAIAASPVPVIAAVHGACIGGGLDLIAASDLRYCAQGAYFSLKEIDIGMVADVGSLQRLPKLVSPGLVREWAFTGRRIEAAEALACGLVNRVFETREALEAGVSELARTIAAKSPLSIRGAKEMLNFGRDHSVAEGLNYIAAWNAAMLVSQDLVAAGMAAMSRETPLFRD